MVRYPCCSDDHNVKKGPWSSEEDEKLVDFINKHGLANWKKVPKLAGLNRCGKSCRLRWTNYLRPDIKRGQFSEEEERIIINLHSILGNKWSRIATHLPGRTDNEIKNFWNTNVSKKLLRMGIDPRTHKPRTDLNHLLNLSQLLGTAAQLGNSMNSHPLDNALRLLLHSDATELIKFQLLQNTLSKILNVTAVTATSNVENTPYNTIGIPENHQDAFNFNPLAMSQALNDFQAINNSWAFYEGGFGSEDHDINNNNKAMTSNFCDMQTEKPFPELVSASGSPEAKPGNFSNDLPASTFCEAWEEFMNDEASGLHWEDVPQC